jgi:tRNA(Arg) A34 adenosine deaminase TadA
MCLGAIYWARLDRIYFGNSAADAKKIGFDDSFIYEQIGQPHPRRAIPMIQLLPEEAWVGFRAWHENPNKVPY